MGACASVPKAMRDETTTPEPPKEDVLRVKAATAASAPYQSLGKLLEEGEASSSSEATKAESSKLKAESLLVPKPAAAVAPKGEETTPVTPLPVPEPAVPFMPKAEVEETSSGILIPPQAEAAARIR